MTEDRWYQVQSYEQALISLKEGKRPIVCLPTGSGKTRVAQKIATDYVAHGKRVLFTAHRSELVNQAARSMPDIETCTIQSSGLARDFDLIIVDECHHATAPSYKRLIKNNPRALILGLTATPTRLDGKSLKGQFDEIIQVAKTSELIEQGYISGIRLFAPDILIQIGKYTRDDLNLANTDRFNDLAVTEYLKIAKGLKGVVFCIDRAHAHAVAASYRKSGIRAVSLDGVTPTDVRVDIDRRWAAGDIDVICNCGLYTEGIDLRDVDFVQILRPTDSLVMYFQMIGRGMRQGGEMILLDHTDNWQHHGLPSDDYVFTLHPEDGKMCASNSKERTHLTRGEDGEVFDTGRPIVDYRLVEVLKKTSKLSLLKSLISGNIYPISTLAKKTGIAAQKIRKRYPSYEDDLYKGSVSAIESCAASCLTIREIAIFTELPQEFVRKKLPDHQQYLNAKSDENDAKKLKDLKDIFAELGTLHDCVRIQLEKGSSIEQVVQSLNVTERMIYQWFPEYRSKT